MGVSLVACDDERCCFTRIPADPTGVLFYDPAEAELPLSLPEYAHFGIREYSTWAENERFQRDHPELTARYSDAEDAYYKQSTGGRIPRFKIRTSDGWWVAPDEIRRSLDALDSLSDLALKEMNNALADLGQGRLEHFQGFVDFLRQAVDLGGFRVH